MQTIFVLIFGAVFGSMVMALTIALALPFSLWSTFVCMQLWNWFMVPVFNIQPIDFLLMWGLIITINAVKGYVVTDTKDEDEKDLKKLIGKAFGKLLTSSAASGIALLMGYIVHRLI